MVIKCLMSLPAGTSWKNVKAILRQQFSLVSTVGHATTQLMQRHPQKGKTLQEFYFRLNEII